MILNLNSQIIWVFVDLLILFVLMKKFLFGPITQMLCSGSMSRLPAVGNPSGRRCSVRRKRKLPLSFC